MTTCTSFGTTASPGNAYRWRSPSAELVLRLGALQLGASPGLSLLRPVGALVHRQQRASVCRHTEDVNRGAVTKERKVAGP